MTDDTRRCCATIAAGGRCRGIARKDTQYCYVHDPASRSANKVRQQTPFYQAKRAMEIKEQFVREASLDPSSRETRSLRDRYIRSLERCAELTLQEKS